MSGWESTFPWLRRTTLAVRVDPLRRNSVTSATTPGQLVCWLARAVAGAGGAAEGTRGAGGGGGGPGGPRGAGGGGGGGGGGRAGARVVFGLWGRRARFPPPPRHSGVRTCALASIAWPHSCSAFRTSARFEANSALTAR